MSLQETCCGRPGQALWREQGAGSLLAHVYRCVCASRHVATAAYAVLWFLARSRARRWFSTSGAELDCLAYASSWAAGWLAARLLLNGLPGTARTRPRCRDIPAPCWGCRQAQPLRWRWLTGDPGPDGPRPTVGWCAVCIGPAQRACLRLLGPQLPGPLAPTRTMLAPARCPPPRAQVWLFLYLPALRPGRGGPRTYHDVLPCCPPGLALVRASGQRAVASCRQSARAGSPPCCLPARSCMAFLTLAAHPADSPDEGAQPLARHMAFFASPRSLG